MSMCMASRYPRRVRFLAYAVDGRVGFANLGSAYTICRSRRIFFVSSQLVVNSVLIVFISIFFICFFGIGDHLLQELEHGLPLIAVER